jgi:hypothetical protein
MPPSKFNEDEHVASGAPYGVPKVQPPLNVTLGSVNDITQVDGPCVKVKGAQLVGAVVLGVGV